MGCNGGYRRSPDWRILPSRWWALALLAVWALAEAGGTVLVRVQQVPLAGFQFHAGQGVWEQLAEGDALTLVREPANRHDPGAVAVHWRNVQLGYLPRSDNRAVAAVMDQGWRISARIGRLVPHPNPWRRVRVDVYAAPP
jgi:hypothetical protein